MYSRVESRPKNHARVAALSTRISRGFAQVRLCHPRLRTDDQAPPSTADAGERWSAIALDAGCRTTLRRQLQRTLTAHRYPVGRTPQDCVGGHGLSHPHQLPLHRPQACSSPHQEGALSFAAFTSLLQSLQLKRSKLYTSSALNPPGSCPVIFATTAALALFLL